MHLSQESPAGLSGVRRRSALRCWQSAETGTHTQDPQRLVTGSVVYATEGLTQNGGAAIHGGEEKGVDGLAPPWKTALPVVWIQILKLTRMRLRGHEIEGLALRRHSLTLLAGIQSAVRSLCDSNQEYTSSHPQEV